MDQRKTLSNYINRARRSLMLERILPIFQYSLLLTVAMCTLILIVSRLFVFPYYRDVALYLAIAIMLLTIIYIWIKRVRKKEALMKLDEYYPNNELVTSLSFEDNQNPLVQSLLQKAEEASQQAFHNFKLREKRLWKPKILISIVLCSIILGILISFPSETQREAVENEKNKEIVKDLKKEVAKLEKKIENKENKKNLQDLKEKLKKADTPEKALREIVKKQKEIKFQQQNLENKSNSEEGLTKEQQNQLKELTNVQNNLIKSLLSTKSQLSKDGKSISSDLQNEIASLSSSKLVSQNSNKVTQELKKEIEKELSKIDDEIENKENKKQLQELKNNLQNIDTLEETLHELVKMQKELKEQEQKLQLQNEEEGLAKEQQKQLIEIEEIQNILSKNLQNIDSKINNLGIEINPTLKKEMASAIGNNSSNGNQNNNQNGNNNSNSKNDNDSTNKGSAGNGLGAGIGQGDRNLLAVPNRIGNKGSTTLDSGPIGSGKSTTQEGTGQMTKGSIRPYKEVIGQYKNSYFESSQRMQLPKDLQSIVQSYFSSLEDD